MRVLFWACGIALIAAMAGEMKGPAFALAWRPSLKPRGLS